MEHKRIPMIVHFLFYFFMSAMLLSLANKSSMFAYIAGVICIFGMTAFSYYSR